MPKVTDDYQVPLPEAIAEGIGIHPGDEVRWVPVGSGAWLLPLHEKTLPVQERLRLFDEATRRQREREKERPIAEEADRGWKREDLYRRGRPD